MAHSSFLQKELYFTVLCKVSIIKKTESSQTAEIMFKALIDLHKLYFLTTTKNRTHLKLKII